MINYVADVTSRQRSGDLSARTASFCQVRSARPRATSTCPIIPKWSRTVTREHFDRAALFRAVLEQLAFNIARSAAGSQCPRFFLFPASCAGLLAAVAADRSMAHD